MLFWINFWICFSFIFYSVSEKPWEGPYEQKIIILHKWFIFHYIKPHVYPSNRAVQAGICGRLLAGFAGSIPPPPGHGCLCLVSVVCRQVEVSATGRSLDQRSHTECGVSGCDREVLIMTRPWPTGGCCDMIKKDKPMVNQTHNIYPSARPSTQIIVYSMQFCFVLAHESFSASQDVFCFLGTWIFISVLP